MGIIILRSHKVILHDLGKASVQHLRVFVPNDINVFLFKISNPLRNAVQNYYFFRKQESLSPNNFVLSAIYRNFAAK